MTVAAEIRAEMGRQGLNYQKLSELTGLTAITLYRKIRHEETPLNLVQLEKCAYALDTTPSELIIRNEKNREATKENDRPSCRLDGR